MLLPSWVHVPVQLVLLGIDLALVAPANRYGRFARRNRPVSFPWAFRRYRSPRPPQPLYPPPPSARAELESLATPPRRFFQSRSSLAHDHTRIHITGTRIQQMREKYGVQPGPDDIASHAHTSHAECSLTGPAGKLDAPHRGPRYLERFRR